MIPERISDPRHANETQVQDISWKYWKIDFVGQELKLGGYVSSVAGRHSTKEGRLTVKSV